MLEVENLAIGYDHVLTTISMQMRRGDRIALLTRSSAELTTKEEPNWERIAGRLLSYSIACDLKATEEKHDQLLIPDVFYHESFSRYFLLVLTVP